MSDSDLISIVIPVYNEADVLPGSIDSIQSVLSSVDYSHEIIIVNDGSTDGTWEAVEELRRNDGAIRGLKLSRNFGQQAAITAGLQASRGDAVVVMDVDLQNPPELIPEFIDRWEDGYDVVYGVFRSREDPLFKRLTSWLFYKVFLKLTSISIPENASDFSLLSRRVVEEINQLPEKNRFIRGLRAWVGFEQTGVEYDKPSRSEGSSKYTFSKLMKLAMDGLLSFSIVPLRVAIVLGLVISLAGFGYNAFVVTAKFLGMTPVGWASLASIDLILGGIQLLVLGIIGEYIGRIYDEVKGRPQFIVEDRLGTSPETG